MRPRPSPRLTSGDLCALPSLYFSSFSYVEAFPKPLHLSGAASGGCRSPPHRCLVSFKVLSVGINGDSEVDNEGRLVLDASVLAVGEGSHLHAVRAGLSERLCGEEHPFHVLIPEGEG